MSTAFRITKVSLWAFHMEMLLLFNYYIESILENLLLLKANSRYLK